MVSVCSCGNYTWYHVWVFVLTFYSYSLYHVTRKSFSNVKSVMQVALSPSNHTEYPNLYPFDTWDSRQFFTSQDKAELSFGYIDSTLLFCYSIGLFLSGWIADRVNQRYLLAGGMVISSILTFSFGSVGPWLEVYNIYYYAVLWGINGLIQSVGWPIVVAVMANWFGKSSRGVIFGVWSANSSVGNIISAVLVASLLPYGFELAMMACSFLMFLGGILIFLCLPEHPDKVGVPTIDDKSRQKESSIAEATNPVFLELNNNELHIRRNSYELAIKSDYIESSSTDNNNEKAPGDDNDKAPGDNSEKAPGDDGGKTRGDDNEKAPCDGAMSNSKSKKKAINFFQAFLIPGVIVYSLSYACVKLVNYSLFFWIPYYLTQRYSWGTASRASHLSTLYDVGGIFGGAIGGWISDRLGGRRSPVVVIMLIFGIVALFCYEGYGTSPLSNGILMCLAGVFVNGPAILEGSAISADLGKHPDIKGDTDALSTVTGIVDGTGSFGAAIGQTLIIVIEQKTNSWRWVFYFLMVMLAGSALFLSKLFICDIMSLWKTCQATIKRKRSK